MPTKRIIILGSERSGTNLLRVLLGNHSLISAPVAVHFFNTFHPFISSYGDLSLPHNSLRLVEHFKQSANHVYTNWNLNMTGEAIVENSPVNSFETAFDAMYKAKTVEDNKQHYVCKDNDLFHFIDLIENLKSNESQNFYIYLYRDPRDHAVSWLKTPLFLHTVFDIAVKWNDEQNAIRRCKETIATHDVKYEDLIRDPERIMKGILEYVSLPIESSCFGTDSQNSESSGNELWKNLSKPILKENQKKLRKKLSSTEINMVETICKLNMERLEYELDTKANWRNPFGFYRRFILPVHRKRKKRRHEAFYNEKMSDLKSKLDFLEQLKKEVTNG